MSSISKLSEAIKGNGSVYIRDISLLYSVSYRFALSEAIKCKGPFFFTDTSPGNESVNVVVIMEKIYTYANYYILTSCYFYYTYTKLSVLKVSKLPTLHAN